jgi:hypothetical protein
MVFVTFIHATCNCIEIERGEREDGGIVLRGGIEVGEEALGAYFVV